MTEALLTDPAEITWCGAHPDRPGTPCDRCGSYVCEECLAPTDDDAAPRCRSCLLAQYQRPWSPRVIGGLTFLFGFLGGGILHVLNARRFGRTGPVVLPIAALFVTFVAFIFLLGLAPEGLGRVLGMAVNLGAMAWFARARRADFDAFTRAGGKPGSGWAAAGLALGATILAASLGAAGLIGVSLVRFEAANAALDAGDYARAEAIFSDECEAGEPAACTNLGWIRENVDQDDAAAREQYRRGCDDGDPMGCNNLALLVGAGRGGAADEAQARRLLDRACADGLELGCENAQLR